MDLGARPVKGTPATPAGAKTSRAHVGTKEYSTMLEARKVTVEVNGKPVETALASTWPPQELRRLAGELPFDEMDEVNLALKICQELDDQALEDLTALGVEGEVLAAVEMLAYSGAIRRWYAARLAAMRPRVNVWPTKAGR